VGKGMMLVVALPSWARKPQLWIFSYLCSKCRSLQDKGIFPHFYTAVTTILALIDSCCLSMLTPGVSGE